MKNINTTEQISSSDPLDLAIWKYMSDRVGRSLRAIGEGLAVHGFEQRTVRDRVVTLFKGGGKSWFIRKQRHNDPIFILKKDCKRPNFPTSAKLEPVLASAFQPQLTSSVTATGNKIIRELIENNPVFKNLDLYNAAKVVTHIAVKYFESRTFTARDMCSIMTENIPEEFEAARGTMHPIEFTQLILHRAVTDGGIMVVSNPEKAPIGEPTRYVSIVYYKRCYSTQIPSNNISTIAIKQVNPFPKVNMDEQKYALARTTIYNVVVDKVFTESQLVDLIEAANDKLEEKPFTSKAEIEKEVAGFVTILLKEKSHRIFDIHLIDSSIPKLPIQYVAAKLYDQKVDEHIAGMNIQPNKEQTTVNTNTINKTDSSKEAVIKAVQNLGSGTFKQIFAYLKEAGHPVSYGGASGQLSRLSSFTPTEDKPLLRILSEKDKSTTYVYQELNKTAQEEKPAITTTDDVIQEEIDKLVTQTNSINKDIEAGLINQEQIKQYAQALGDADGGAGDTGVTGQAMSGPAVYQFNHSNTTNAVVPPLFEHVIRVKGKVMTEEEISAIMETYLLVPQMKNALVSMDFTIAGIELSYNELKEIAMRIESIKNNFLA